MCVCARAREGGFGCRVMKGGLASDKSLVKGMSSAYKGDRECTKLLRNMATREPGEACVGWCVDG